MNRFHVIATDKSKEISANKAAFDFFEQFSTTLLNKLNDVKKRKNLWRA